MKITTKNVSAGYVKGNYILQGISFSLEEGGVWGILGPNGSGKTTLLRVLAGLLPYEGETYLELTDQKLDISKANRKTLAKYISMMPQFSSIYFSYSIYDTVLMGRYAHHDSSISSMLGSTTKADINAVEKALEITGLTEIKSSQLSALSGGQLQRVLLARTIAQETPIILLDEPTNHLDLKFQNELTDFLQDWSKGSTEVEGIAHRNTVVSVFHDIRTASLVSDNVILVKDGNLIKKGPAEDILCRDLLSDLFDTDVERFM